MSYYTCEGLSDLANGPNQPSATLIGEYSASYHHGALIPTWSRATISGSANNLTLLFGDTSLMSGMFPVCSVYVACKGLSDLGNGPNQPSVTIIGQYSASLLHAAYIVSCKGVKLWIL